jgi:hypothetical protein
MRSAQSVQCGGKDMETLEGNMCSSASQQRTKSHAGLAGVEQVPGPLILERCPGHTP